MLFFILLPTIISALDCSKHGFEVLDVQNVETMIFDTPPARTRRTGYFNPCSPLVGIPECGEGTNYCAIDEREVNGKWVIEDVRPYASSELATNETVWIWNDYLMIYYDTYIPFHQGRAHAEAHYFCDSETTAGIGRGVEDTFSLWDNKTPIVCGLKTDENNPPYPPNYDDEIEPVDGDRSLATRLLDFLLHFS